MYRAVFIAIAFLVSLPCAAGELENECLYGPYDSDLSTLKSQHPGSRFTKDHSGLIIPAADGEITVTFDGCEHYGMEISLAATGKEAFTRKEAFARAVELVREFSGKNINADKLKELLAQGKYTTTNDGSAIVPYPNIDEFGIEFYTEHGHPTVVVSYSCC